ncbi:MAG TPA: SDR family oxidoreductase [Terriglobales bacterium]|nr:SDR family oxidoreductase [Terriglobales bacterium]
MAESPLQEQVAIVTGASQGIGRAIALRLATLGARLVLVARNKAALTEAAAAIAAAGAPPARVMPCDLRAPEAMPAVIKATLEASGRLDILVNNAGVGWFGQPLHQTSEEIWNSTLATNLTAVYHAMRAAAPAMIERRAGHIINIASLAGHNPVPGAAAYAASKWGLHGLSISAAEELRSFGIRVSLVCPGSVDTDLSPQLVGGKDRTRMLTPDDIAHAVAMLVTQSPRSFISEVLIRPTLKP